MDDYVMLGLEAEAQAARGFFLGWCTASGLAPQEVERRILWPEAWDIRAESTLGSLLEAVRPGPVCHVVVEAELAASLLEAMQPWAESLPTRLRTRQRLLGALFDFRFELFAREEAAAVRRILAELPEGVSVSPDYAPEETAEPRAAGVEMYAPVHGYTCKAHGSVRGRLRGVLEVRERCRQHERVRVGQVLLQLE